MIEILASLRPAGSPVYLVMMLAGMALGAVCWSRQARSDPRLVVVFSCGLAGAFGGAKLAYLLSEGWLHWNAPERWQIWLSGKSVAGGLPGGWLGVELAKAATGYRKSTGDRFAMLLPLTLLLGRIGCLSAGCCRGIPLGAIRWPAVEVEMGFQVFALVALWLMRRRRIMVDRLFFVYLAAYGLFRFFHEFVRDTPKPLLYLSGYQWVSLATAAAAIAACVVRTRRMMR